MFTQPRSRPVSSAFLAILMALGILLLFTTLTFAKSAGTIVVNPGDSILSGAGVHATATIIVTNTNDSGLGSLRQAIASASFNDTIEFSLTYPAMITLTSGQITIDKDLTINGPGATNLKVSGNNSSRVFSISGNVSIADLTIQDGSAPYAAGIYATNALTLTNVNILSNTATTGAGVFVGGPARLFGGLFQNNLCLSDMDSLGGGLLAGNTLVLSDTQFISNTAAIHGGAVYVSGAATFLGGLFLNNHASRGGGVYANSTLELRGTKFLSNTADEGGGLYHAGVGSDRIVNALFADNAVGRNGAGVYIGSSGSTVVLYTTISNKVLSSKQGIYVQTGTVGITDTILANHAIGIENVGGDVYEDYNLFFGNTLNLSGTVISGTHDVFGNPHFVDPVNNDYHIVPPSAAINAGVDAGVYTDLDGNVRPIGTGFDIGAYEATNTTTPISGLVAVNDSPTPLGEETILFASVQAGDQVSYQWDFGDGSAPDIYQAVMHTYPAVGIYTAIVTASNSVSVVTATTRVTVDVPLSGLLAVNDSPTLFGNATTLTATISAGSNVTYTWNFGDGSATARGITTTHVYPAGVYTASVIAQNSLSVMTATTRVTVTDVPVSGLLAVNNSPTAIGNATTLTATIGVGSNVTYTWNFGDGSTTAIGQVFTHTYPFSVTSRFTATVTALNSVSTQSATTLIIITPKRIYLSVVIKP